MRYASIAVLLIATLVSCHETGRPETETTGTSQSPSTSTLDPTTTGASGGTVSNLTPSEKEFVVNAGMSGLAEVKIANLALERAANASVKAFAQRMITDHAKANAELTELATSKGAALATELEGEHEVAFRHLMSLSGPGFDRSYMDHMVADHEKDVAEFQKAASSAQDADLKAWAAKTLATLQQHLALAREVRGKV